MAKKEKPRDHPFAKYIRKEVLRKARVDAERDKLKTKTYKVKIEKVTKWGNKKFVKRSKTR